MIAELEAMRKQHMAIAFIVDDNLIGNKNAIKEVLRDVVAWQEAEGYPFTFFTEASLDLSEDDELMELMVDANISSSLSASKARTKSRSVRRRSIKTFARAARSSIASAKFKTPASKSGAA